MSFIKKIAKKSINEYAGIVSEGTYLDNNTFIDTGCYILNAQLSGSIYGGFPNTIIGIMGLSGVGKTYLALSIVKNFLEENKKNEVCFFESEGAVSKKLIEERGIDSSRVYLVPVESVQDFRKQAYDILKDYEEEPENNRPKMLFVLDSLGNLASGKEIADTEAGKDVQDMSRAKIIRSTFRILTLKLAKLGVPMFLTNHVYESTSSYIPTKIPAGGAGAIYAASVILELSKRKEKDGEEIIGNILKSKMYKGRQTKENTQIEMLLSYTTGLDKYYGLMEIALKYKIFEKISTKIKLLDGSTVFEKRINDDPEKYYTKEILDKIDAACQKEFMYGSSEEQEDVIEEETEESTE